MKIGFIINDIETEKAKYTTIRLAMTATNMGHEAWLIGVGDLAYDPDDYIRANAVRAPSKKYKSSEIYLKDLLNANRNIAERISIDRLDVVMLRNDPASELSGRAWAKSIGIHFGRVAVKHGVIVVNDPGGLSNASNKMYFQQFPKEIRPKTLITRDRLQIRNFAKKHKKIIIKPLVGSSGKNVFLVTSKNLQNTNQIIDAVSRDGYIVAQEYLKIAEQGDVRLFLMNGIPLKHKGKYAAFKRVSQEGDIRNNSHVGGISVHVDVDPTMLKIAEIIRPKLVQDGMFLVGIDIVGDKILEVNVFSPGGLGKASELENVNFLRCVIHALERKVEYMSFYRRKFNNVEMCNL